MQILSNAQIAKLAPSVFATQPYEAMTERYKFVPTNHVIDLMRENGFQPVRVQQSRCRIAGKEEFTKHMIRFRHEDHHKQAIEAINAVSTHLHDVRMNDKTLPEIPEIVLVNSHDGSSGYELSAGLFRQVCANGLVISCGDIDSIKIRHSGKSIDDFAGRIIDGTYQILDETPKVMQQIEQWKNIDLTEAQQIRFAHAANELKPLPAAIEPINLLRSRRLADNTEINGKRDLFTTMNVIQENMLRGGLRGRNEARRRVSTRTVKSVTEDMRLNKALWQLFSAGADNLDKIAA